jgi:acetyl esterase/lipase
MDLKLDIMVPSVGRGPFPAIVFFPGNGFGFYYTIDRSQCRAHLLDFVEKGYVVLEADVRSCVDWAAGVPTSPYPAPLYDAKSVIRWLRANAAQYHVDTNRIGVAGWSSGGTLALTLALTRPEDGLEGDVGVLGYPTDVRAAAVTGVMVDFDFDEIEQKVGIVTYLGVPHSDSPELYRSASPIRFLREGAPPIFQVEGESDHFSVDQAPSFHARLTELGIPNELFVVPGLGHNDYLGRTQTLAFFDRYLKGGAASADQ